MPNPRVFLDVAIGEQQARRIVIELFADQVPKTSENFRCLCTGERGIGPVSGKPLHYKGSVFHRVIEEFMVQGGDIINGDGTGGESIYGRVMADENFKINHGPFHVAVANKGPHTGSSQFFITTAAQPHLDGSHVVFGHVVHGQDVVLDMEKAPVDDSSCPLQPIRIVHCGELEMKVVGKKDKKKKSKSSKKHKSSSKRKRRHDSSASSDSDSADSDADTASRKHKKKRKKRKKHRRSRSSSSDSASSRSRSPSPAQPPPAQQDDGAVSEPEEPPRPESKRVTGALYREMFLDRKPRVRSDRVDYEGRDVRGRGRLKYRPTESFERPSSPPHRRRNQSRDGRSPSSSRPRSTSPAAKDAGIPKASTAADDSDEGQLTE
ncbi:hypothetical protein RI367_008419 [Sorochytrium milnesiophthora]